MIHTNMPRTWFFFYFANYHGLPFCGVKYSFLTMHFITNCFKELLIDQLARSKAMRPKQGKLVSYKFTYVTKPINPYRI